MHVETLRKAGEMLIKSETSLTGLGRLFFAVKHELRSDFLELYQDGKGLSRVNYMLSFISKDLTCAG